MLRRWFEAAITRLLQPMSIELVDSDPATVVVKYGSLFSVEFECTTPRETTVVVGDSFGDQSPRERAREIRRRIDESKGDN